MDSLSRSRSLPKPSRFRQGKSSSKLTPRMAAAMLSLHWSPPEKPRTDNEDDEADSNNNRRPGAAKGASSRKLHQKKNDKLNNNEPEEDELQTYEPVTTPRFHEVQTAWPGFDHEPVDNWEEKYLIAKPYPRNEADISKKSSFMNYGNDRLILSTNDEAAPLRNFKSRSMNRTAETGNKQSTNEMITTYRYKPKRIIHLERVGSCLK